jgi:hypothetical protein
MGWEAFKAGIRYSVRYPQVVLAFYAVSLASGIFLAAVSGLALLGPAHRTAIQEVADGIDAWLVVELLLSPLSQGQLTGAQASLPGSVQQVLLIVFITLVLMPLVAWLPSSFLYGGTLSTYIDAPSKFQWTVFLRNCWRWWGRFLLFGFIQGVLGIVLIGLVSALILVLASVFGAQILWIGLIVGILVAIAWLAWMDFSRLMLIATSNGNLFRAMSQGFAFTLRHTLAWLGLYGLVFGLLAAVNILYRGIILPALPLSAWPLVFIVQQSFIFLRLWSRSVRLAGGAALIQSQWSREADLVTTPVAEQEIIKA